MKKLRLILTPNQLEVLKLMAAGLTNKAIAKQRGARIDVVSHQITSIYKKLGLYGKTGVYKRIHAIRMLEYDEYMRIHLAKEEKLDE